MSYLERTAGVCSTSLELKCLIQEHNKKEKQAPLQEPDFMKALTGGKMAYNRQDGVKIIPLGCLKY